MKRFLRAFADIPRLPGALCRGSSWLFDSREGDEDPDAARRRHDLAARACHECPELAPCRMWVRGLPSSRRPNGVVAGLIPGGRGRPRGVR